jgi:CRP-like cAMP-binding protein
MAASKSQWEKLRALFGVGALLKAAAPDSCALLSYENLRSLFDAGETGPEFELDFSKKLSASIPTFLPELPTENFLALCRDIELIRYEPGEIVVSVGDIPDAWYFVVSGSLDVYMNTEDAKKNDNLLYTKKCGEHFGEIAFMRQEKRRTATVCCTHLSRSVVLKVRKYKYVKYVLALHQDAAIMETKIQFLEKCATLKSLRRTSLKKMAYTLKEAVHPPFTVVREQNAECDCIFIIVSGSVRLVHRFYGGSNVELACLLSTNLVGLVDYIESGALDPEDHPTHRCAIVTGPEQTTVYKMSLLTFKHILMSEMGPEIEALAKVRKSWEIMRISNAIEHPEIHIPVDASMLESYGYIGMSAIDAFRHKKKVSGTTTSSSLEKAYFARVQQARSITRATHKAMTSLGTEHPITEDIARKLRHASLLFEDASKIARNDNRLERSAMAKKLAVQIMLPVHSQTLREKVKAKGHDVQYEHLEAKFSSFYNDVSQLIGLETSLRQAIQFWSSLKQFAFYHGMADFKASFEALIHKLLLLTDACIRSRRKYEKRALQPEQTQAYVRRPSTRRPLQRQSSSDTRQEAGSKRIVSTGRDSFVYNVDGSVSNVAANRRKSADTAMFLNWSKRSSAVVESDPPLMVLTGSLVNDTLSSNGPLNHPSAPNFENRNVGRPGGLHDWRSKIRPADALFDEDSAFFEDVHADMSKKVAPPRKWY